MQKQWYLQSMGISTWVERDKQIATSPSMQTNIISEMDWESLRQTVSVCTRCELHKTRTQTVFGVGNQQAELVVVGEAPGAEEDKRGEPFVGRAGKLLDEMLAAIGLPRKQIYIANILKCRPPQNRDPKPEEQQCCTPFLLRQLALIKPKLILAVGRIAAQYLLQSNLSLSRLRTQQHFFSEMNIPLIITYHPAYLLRSPKDKKNAYMDLLKVKNFLQMKSSA